MIKTSKYLKSKLITKHSSKGKHKINPRDAFLCMQVHDELVFDFPIEQYPKQHVRPLKRIIYLMNKAAQEYGMPSDTDLEMVTEKSDWGSPEQYTYGNCI